MIRFYTLMFFSIVGFSCNSDSGNKPVKEGATVNQQAKKEMKNILFFGNSLTAGYGLDDPETAFPALIQQRIDSAKLDYKVINGGLSGETTAGGLNRIDWLLKQKVDVFVLELGANDGLRGIDPASSQKNLDAIVTKVKAKYPEVKLVMLGMEVPPNMGNAYAAKFRVIFRQIAEKHDMVFIPFLLEGVAGNVKLNLKDGIHPTAEGYKIVAETVWKKLSPVL